MAFLHCHNCEWQQDDFWDEDYNPLKSTLDWKNALLNEELDESFTNDAEFLRERGNLTLREVIAQDLEREANKIRNMRYRSLDEFSVKNPEKICPNCGEQKLDID